jgi:hypothetical protein
MEPVQIVGLGVTSASLLVYAAAKIGVWWERQMQAAEFRRWQQLWKEEVSTQINQSTTDWPMAGQATRTFFGVDEVSYDPDADTSAFMARQDREAQEFLRQLRER